MPGAIMPPRALIPAAFFAVLTHAGRIITARDCQENRLRNDTACLKSGRPNGDCCGCPFATACADGFERVLGRECHIYGAVTTCCYHPTLMVPQPPPWPPWPPPLPSLPASQPQPRVLASEYALIYLSLVLLVLLAPPAVARLSRQRCARLQPANQRRRGWLVVGSLRVGYVLLAAAVLPTVLKILFAFNPGKVNGTAFEDAAICFVPSALTLMVLAVRPSVTDRGVLRAWAIGSCTYSAVVAFMYLLYGPRVISRWRNDGGCYFYTWQHGRAPTGEARFLFGGIGHVILLCMLVPLLRGPRMRTAEADMRWKLNYLWRVFRIYCAWGACFTTLSLVVNGSNKRDFSFFEHFDLYVIAIQSAAVSIFLQPRVRAYFWLFSSFPALAFGPPNGWSTRVTFQRDRKHDTSASRTHAHRVTCFTELEVAVPETWREDPPGLGARVVLQGGGALAALDETEGGGHAHDFALGEGGFGAVFRVRLDNEDVAAKISKRTTSSQVDALRREGLVMLSLANESQAHVCRCRGMCMIKGRPTIVLDLHRGGTLSEVLALQSQRNPPAAPLAAFAHRWRLAPQIAAGLAHIHACGFLHLDIKGSNVLLDATLHHAVISDFGCATIDPEPSVPLSDLALHLDTLDEGVRRELVRVERGVHTLRYVAPEVCISNHESRGADVYALGHLLWELIYCEMIFATQTGLEVIVQRISGGAEAMPSWGAHPPPALATDYSYDHQPADAESAGGHVSTAMEPELWAELIALVSECWRLEAAARPDARSLERRLIRVSDALPEPLQSPPAPRVLHDIVPVEIMTAAANRTTTNTAKVAAGTPWVAA